MKKLLSIVLALCMALSLCVTTWAADGDFVDGVANVSTAEGLRAAFVASGGTNNTINITADIDFTGKTWDYSSDISTGCIAGITINGKGHTISNLPAMLINWGRDITINDLTLYKAKAEVTTDAGFTALKMDDVGIQAVGAFVGYYDSDALTIKNCKLVDSTVTSSGYAAGFVGYAAGANEGAFAAINLIDCVVEDSVITGGNSTGGLMGHAIGSEFTSVTVTNATVKGNIITCTDDSNVKAGSLFGTASTAEDDVTLSVSANTSDNTVKSGDETTGVATITTIYGRQVNDKTTLTLTGGSYDNAPLGASDDWAVYADDTPVAIGDDNYYYVGSDSIVAAVKAGTVVEVIVGGAIEGLPYGIVVTVEEGEDEPEEYALFVNDEAGDKTTLNGTSALGGSYYVLTDPPAEPAHSHTRRQPTTTVVTPDTTTTDTVTSAKTFDAGIAVYAAMGVLSLTGSAWIVGKKRG